MDIDEPEPEIAAPVKTLGKRDQPGAASLPWVEKYRPSSLDELISHDAIITTLNKLIESGSLPHLLFYGPPGTGKTSTILAVARKMNGPHYQNLILELNASDDRKIDTVRDQIKEFASTKMIFEKGLKLVILDEADAMTNDAQAALRRVIEKYASNTRFCLICNHVGKIIPAIQSRCTRFRFSPLSDDQVRGRLDLIIKAEKITVTDDGRKALLRLARGDMRKVLNVLQATSMAYDEVNEDNVYLCTGNPLPRDVKQILEWMLNEDMTPALQKIMALKVDRGMALQDVLRDVNTTLGAMRLHDAVLIELYDKLAEIEHRLAGGASEKLQLAAVVAVFQRAREMIAGD